MRTTPIRRGLRGYISFLMVMSTGTVLSLLMVYSYRSAARTQAVQADVQLHLDYSEKEEALLRSIVAIAPNRAMRAMQSGSDASTTTRNPLRWQNIFGDALDQSNARKSIDATLVSSLNLTNSTIGNSGDSGLGTVSRIFRAATNESGFVSPGINRSLGTGYPAPLTCSDTTASSRDITYPIITNSKVYGSLAEGMVGLPTGNYPNFNLINYPQINFGYCRPGEPFVAKRNWWMFQMDVADHDDNLTSAARFRRQFVFSIYEIPSQLAISASSFMSLGTHSNGDEWQNVTIDGGVFAGRAQVDGGTSLTGLTSRRSMTVSEDSQIGGQTIGANAFAPGVRELHELTTGEFFPVSLPSESGRAAFIPINRGADYFDRIAHAAESSTVSTTSWNNYSVGALQCAMRIDITDCVSTTNPTPTVLRFSYLRNGVRQTVVEPQVTGIVSTLPPGYVKVCDENQSFTFNSVVDVAYGINGKFFFQKAVTGTVAFTNARFGDPNVGVFKAGYFRPSPPYEVKVTPGGKTCIAVYPERFPAYLTMIGADGPAMNHSIVANVDYAASVRLRKPSIPCTDLDYGLILEECANLSAFTKGFSVVTNLRLYIGDDFNITPAAAPPNYPAGKVFYPPCSLFAPEKRFGVEMDPFAIQLEGQIGSLAGEDAANPVRPLDSKGASGQSINSGRITVNLRPILHPAELPPVTMMNWLVVVEERKKEYFTAN